jgi:hypothetical protein
MATETTARLTVPGLGGAMIKFLAQLIRGLHYIIGISEPPPDTSDRTFVFTWLGMIALFVALGAALFGYVIPFLYFKR